MMAVYIVVGVLCGVYFLVSWTVYHHRWGKYERRGWSLARVDALLWVAVMTGYLLLRAERAILHGGWGLLPDSHHLVVVAVLTGLGCLALVFRALWWRHELVTNKARTAHLREPR